MRIVHCLLVSAILLVSGCARKPTASHVEQRSPNVAAAGGDGPLAAPTPLPAMPPAPTASNKTDVVLPNGAALAADDRVFGKGEQFGNLVVYPVTSHAQVDVGPLVSLDDAIANGTAEVRETAGGGSVNQLVIENKGKIAIFVLAGTVVKGGNQDRQIGQDFIIDPKQTTPVDAFCVEHGRWNGQRAGQGTGGKFVTSDVVATSKVRAAGQYQKNQGEVWSKVGESNAAHKKTSASGTFLASVDDAQIAKDRAALSTKIQGVLDGVKPADDVVGVAYAIDGEVRGVRWFAHHKVFAMHEKKLANGIALEAMTAKAETEAQGKKPSTAPPPAPAAVDAFVKDVEKQQVKEQRDTPAANVNTYYESTDSYGSSVSTKARPNSPAKAVSKDFTKK